MPVRSGNSPVSLLLDRNLKINVKTISITVVKNTIIGHGDIYYLFYYLQIIDAAKVVDV